MARFAAGDHIAMAFISYAQNFEDVILWRALKHIEKGFYIDIGAAWPAEHSVTKAFYDHGWHGINIEPNPELYEQLVLQREKDINLPFAISNSISEETMSVFAGTGLSTCCPDIASQHEVNGFKATVLQVKTTTIQEVWDQYAKNCEVHFLKIDVEGLEEKVLLSNDWKKNRPWILLIEATIPMSQKECYQDWESILTDSNYQVVYSDGLNRYYLASEHSDLLKFFQYPPNVFDDYTLVEHLKLAHRVQASEKKVQASEKKVQASEKKEKKLIDRVSFVEGELAKFRDLTESLRFDLQAVYSSHSWKITKPLRKISQIIRMLRERQ